VQFEHGRQLLAKVADVAEHPVPERVVGRAHLRQHRGRRRVHQPGPLAPAKQRGEVHEVVPAPAVVEAPGDGVHQVERRVAADELGPPTAARHHVPSRFSVAALTDP